MAQQQVQRSARRRPRSAEAVADMPAVVEVTTTGTADVVARIDEVLLAAS